MMILLLTAAEAAAFYPQQSPAAQLTILKQLIVTSLV